MNRQNVAKKMPSRYRYSIKNNPKKSKSGTCKECLKMAGAHNFASSGTGGKFPPYHPNCKCGMS